MPAATRADVAKLAGTSVAVVSYVVNDGPRPVADPTRERVLAAIAKLGYRPNGIARSLRRQRNDVIGLIVPDVANAYFSEIADAIEEAAAEAGYLVLLASTSGDESRESKFISSFSDQQVSGLIVISSEHNLGWSRSTALPNIPMVSVDRAVHLPSVTSITVDNRHGARLATEHLVWHGHRRIGHIGGQTDVAEMVERSRGWQDAIEAAGAQHDSRLAIVAPLDKLGGFHAAERLLDRHGVTAIFAASDQQAIGAMKAIAERGLITGRDVAVIGFDGVAEGAFTVPGLTTMAQPIRKMGEEAVRALLSSVDTDLPAPSQTYDVVMITRGSCGCVHDVPRLGMEALALTPRGVD